MLELLQRYRALDSEARKTLRRAVVLLPLVRVSLRLRGYRRTQEWLQGLGERGNSGLLQTAKSKDTVEKTCRMVRAAVRHSMPGASCLEASLTLWLLLKQQGVSASLRIGVRKNSGVFEAHAWVEHEGSALNQLEAVHRHYAPFDSELDVLSKERE